MAFAERVGREPLGSPSFTLLELLVVIGLIAVLAAVTVVVLNPTELLNRSRDTVRVNEISSIHRALGYYDATAASPSFGLANKVYISHPDSSQTCASWTGLLPPLPTGWEYRCAAQADFRKLDGNGWIPVDFTSSGAGAPFAALPIDPVNDADHYYTYSAGSRRITAVLESSKSRDAQKGLMLAGVANALANGDFEDGIAGWSSVYWGGTLTSETGVITVNAKSMKISDDAPSTYSDGYQELANYTQYLGKTMTLGAWVRAPNTNPSNQVLGIEFNPAGECNSGNIPKDNAWHWMTLTCTIPMNATRILPRFFADRAATPGTGDVLYVDGAFFFSND